MCLCHEALIQTEAWVWGCIINRDPSTLRDRRVQNLEVPSSGVDPRRGTERRDKTQRNVSSPL